MKFTLNKPVIYVVRDLERTLGLPVTTKGYYIISNYTTFANSLVKGRKNVLLIKNTELLDTRELLIHAKTINFIKKIKNPQVLVFKNTLAIEKICQENGWPLLNPSAELASEVEEKITQVQWLGSLKKYLPPFEVRIANDVKWTGKKFILQFNRAHTGSGTILVENKEQLVEIQTKFPNREVRITKFINGPMLTNNNVVWGNKILCGNISYQITGLKPFTSLPFATVGNDWALPHKILSTTQKKEYEKMAQEIGTKMFESGWKGLFGIDVICDEKTGKLYLIEINARQPASTSFESILQAIKNINGLTSFQAHLLALLGEKNVATKLIAIKGGAQITQKIVPMLKKINITKIINKIKRLNNKKIKVFVYENIKPESDLIRMQSTNGLMASPNILNKLGQELEDFSMSILNN
jgi:predicted ATP-grasp superfamily ATP-dependent carboligase